MKCMLPSIIIWWNKVFFELWSDLILFGKGIIVPAYSPLFCKEVKVVNSKISRICTVYVWLLLLDDLYWSTESRVFRGSQIKYSDFESIAMEFSFVLSDDPMLLLMFKVIFQIKSLSIVTFIRFNNIPYKELVTPYARRDLGIYLVYA